MRQAHHGVGLDVVRRSVGGGRTTTATTSDAPATFGARWLIVAVMLAAEIMAVQSIAGSVGVAVFGSVFFDRIAAAGPADSYRTIVVIQAALLVVFLALTLLFPRTARPEGDQFEVASTPGAQADPSPLEPPAAVSGGGAGRPGRRGSRVRLRTVARSPSGG